MPDKRKIRRNESCPCGSGKKYKKCHGSGNTDMLHSIKRAIHHNNKHKAKYGDVTPILSEDFHGHKIVISGNRLNYSKKWKTFHDFLLDYLRMTLGNEWGAEELEKEPSERHPVIQWYITLCDFQRRNVKKEGEIYTGICTGTVAAYLSLAYDLYLLKHHALLQKRLVNRLKIKDQFQGARYEAYVTSIFIKAGFDIDFEDESDRSISHCEFKAIHKSTGQKYSIEAKSRHRLGLLGQPGRPKKPEEIRLRVGRLLRSALAKHAANTRMIFIDINMPPEEVGPFSTTWFKPLMEEIKKVEGGKINSQQVPSAYLAITNHPYHYAGNDKPDPRKNYLLTAINRPEFKKKPDGTVGPIDSVISNLWDSMNKHTEIPHEFNE